MTQKVLAFATANAAESVALVGHIAASRVEMENLTVLVVAPSDPEVLVQAVTLLYTSAAEEAFKAKNYLLKIRVLVQSMGDIDLNSVTQAVGLTPTPPLDIHGIAYEQIYLDQLSPRASRPLPPSLKYIPVDKNAPRQTRTVVLGGTFDHLHAGHLILLSTAALLAKEKLICGVYDFANTPERLARKAHSKFMEPLEVRIAAVKEFLTSFKPSLEYRVEGILDDYGPTRNEEDMDAIVASAETELGCLAVNKLRKENGLRELDIYIAGVVGNPELFTHGDNLSGSGIDAGSSISFGDKISSSFLRGYLSERNQTTN